MFRPKKTLSVILGFLETIMRELAQYIQDEQQNIAHEITVIDTMKLSVEDRKQNIAKATAALHNVGALLK